MLFFYANPVLIAAAVLPAIFLLIQINKADKLDREPPGIDPESGVLGGGVHSPGRVYRAAGHHGSGCPVAGGQPDSTAC